MMKNLFAENRGMLGRLEDVEGQDVRQSLLYSFFPKPTQSTQV